MKSMEASSSDGGDSADEGVAVVLGEHEELVFDVSAADLAGVNPRAWRIERPASVLLERACEVGGKPHRTCVLLAFAEETHEWSYGAWIERMLLVRLIARTSRPSSLVTAVQAEGWRPL